MKNLSRGLPFKNFFEDFLVFLKADINVPLKVKEIPKAEFYSGQEKYFDIVVVNRQKNLSRRSYSTRLFDGLIYESKIKSVAFFERTNSQ